MKKTGIVFLLGSLITPFGFSAPGDTFREQVRNSIEPHLGTKRPYTHPDIIAAPPPNCSLVHINHLGRHGSRYPGGDAVWKKEFQKPAEALGLADPSSSSLTPAGQALATIIQQQIALYNGPLNPAGEITKQGEQEQAAIAERLIASSGLSAEAFLDNLKRRSAIAKSTVVHRTHTSRIAFLQGWERTLGVENQKALNVAFQTPTKDELDTELQFYQVCKKMVTGWKEVVDNNLETIYQPRNTPEVREKMSSFSSSFISDLNAKQSLNFNKLAHKLCALDANQNYELGICHLLSQAPEFKTLFEAYGQISNRRQFYGRGPAKEHDRLNATSAVVLLDSFLSTTSAAIENPDSTPFVELRFAHESTLLRLMQALNLVNYENSTNKQGEITWNVSSLCPMSSNLVWQTYRCEGDSADVYKTRMLMNERVMPFPVAGCDRADGLCEWQTVEAFYSSLYRGVSLNDVCGDVSLDYSDTYRDNQ
ncbi:histidine-type phosphatase [Parendozoicomonas haliclonae]|uniref:Multiple inositol polyphosphate phosphatase 1 n=1 Tax=Parendozoicomonas haliclonae TaxID=1960125 RepID=A0A1X7AM20_9GAMM|nr:histidine-type phosphatase [Parendozoicomonas haliclonae]SMA46723.1 Histidine phosphatase superfamily (branch 2) [Parendozoicomonas haliclonae]